MSDKPFFSDNERDAVREFIENLGGNIFDFIQILKRRPLENTAFDAYTDHKRDFVKTSLSLSDTITNFLDKINSNG